MCSRKPMALHIVPEGRNTAASKPRSSATRSQSRFTVGSPKCCSSPTSASAIARRISGVGRVWVSEKRLTRGIAGGTLARALRQPQRDLARQALDALAELREPGARAAGGAHQARVEARGALLAEPAVDVDPLDPLVALGELEHVLR